ncbi:glucan biosynthesis protein [Roseibium sp.]|uniref:glucan biosynthesis protein n=1 Tax=Roseibium sp. TaxID=1936156 RepID=UPI003A97200B
MIDRRTFLLNASLGLGCACGLPVALVSGAHAAGEAEDFSFDSLKAKMREKAKTPYVEPAGDLPEKLANLTYDQHRAIRFRPDHALWKDGGSNFELQAFHPGWLFKHPVDLHEVIGDRSWQLHFTGADFEYREPLKAEEFTGMELPGIAGFRLHYPLNRPDYRDELITFLGASYFRALGKDNLYGLSARGLAVDTAAGRDEEFPNFTRFYLERPVPGQNRMRIWAELESPRVTGAYAFTITPGINTEVDVDANIYLRGDVERLGVAPLTSMYLYGENDRTGFDDYRPEVHDSDGLLTLRKDGELLWRPLRNPNQLALSFFGEDSPKGFGLIQRDRHFDSYQDTEAHYEKRPSLWIEPIGEWGKGQIMLAEIPSDKEIHDNIVAFWVPEKKAEAGSEHRFRYRMHWGGQPEPGTGLAQVRTTRTGQGGTAASEPDPRKRKFAVEFAGGPLAKLGSEAKLEADLKVNNATLMAHQLATLENGVWRQIFDVKQDDSGNPVELALTLKHDGKTVTETWLYQWARTV